MGRQVDGLTDIHVDGLTRRPVNRRPVNQSTCMDRQLMIYLS